MDGWFIDVSSNWDIDNTSYVTPKKQQDSFVLQAGAVKFAASQICPLLA
jgi:hypothetical protein